MRRGGPARVGQGFLVTTALTQIDVVRQLSNHAPRWSRTCSKPAVMAELPPKIFIADDDQLLLEGLSRALTGRGYTVRTAPDGPKLLSLMERESPDLVVLDIMMPGMSGLDVLRRVRDDGRWPEVPVMMVTALTDAEVTESARDRGASDVVHKPFRLRDLVSRIELWLRAAGRGDAVADPTRSGE